MQSDGKYNVEFYISLQDSVNYGVKNVGIHFSNYPHNSNIDTLLNLIPQVKYTGHDFLDEKNGWTKVSGSFVALGGEKFIAIGNFDIDENTDTVFVAGGGLNEPPGLWDVASYFIDDVSVILDTSVGVDDLEKDDGFKVYPNPAKNSITIEYILSENQQPDARFEMYDVAGRIVIATKLTSNKTTVDTDKINSGIYYYCIKRNDEIKHTGKQIIIK